jgi:hypothetical protein
MATSSEDIKRWFDDGQRKNATHMIVVCDTYDHETYPVYVSPGENVREKTSVYERKEMQRVMEVYSYKHPIDKQLLEERSFHYD